MKGVARNEVWAWRGAAKELPYLVASRMVLDLKETTSETVPMPGLHSTDRQVVRYMSLRPHHPQVTAAAKAGFSERSARRIDSDPRLPTQSVKTREWRTRQDPLTHVWPRAEEMLKTIPGIQAISILEVLQEEYGPDTVPDSLRRTLERRVANWQALHGEDKEVFFPQRHDAGRQGLSDFTVADELAVTIGGQPFQHRLYHFRLAFSGWEDARVILGGESFSAIAEGLQDALWKLGGVPAEHRTDSLSAAFKNLAQDAQLDLTRRYQNLSKHYNMEATRNNPGESHENGSIEAANRHIKTRIDQALRRRGSRDFADLSEYRRFIADLCARYNARRKKAVDIERAVLRPLPLRRTTDFASTTVPVTRNSTISVDRILYSVPSRLIGCTLEIHLYDDRLEAFLGATLVATLVRLRVKAPERGHQIDYHDVIGTLRRKPQALRNLIYRDALFPRPAYARAWAALDAGRSAKQACRDMVGLLDLAANGACEAALAERLDAILDAGALPDIDALKAEFAPKTKPPADVTIPLPDLAAYNQLLPSGGEVRP